MDAMVEAFERAAIHARRTNLPSQLVLGWCSLGRFFGTTPLSELLAWQDEQDEGVRRSFLVRSHRAQALAALGRLGEARAALTELSADLDQRGGRFGRISARGVALALEVLGGDPATAVAAGEEECRRLEELGHKAQLSRDAGRLAQAYYELGRLEDAEAWAERAAKLAGSDDAHAQTIWRQVKAKVLARGGDHAEAERFARRAVELSEQTDMLIDQGRALADLGDVLALAGRTEAAAEAYEQALARCERKEYLVMVERIRARLVELRLSETAQRA
jgi:tetratricopeptide (TPR) repeat protein